MYTTKEDIMCEHFKRQYLRKYKELEDTRKEESNMLFA
jgi:hypothetical protein